MLWVEGKRSFQRRARIRDGAAAPPVGSHVKCTQFVPGFEIIWIRAEDGLVKSLRLICVALKIRTKSFKIETGMLSYPSTMTQSALDSFLGFKETALLHLVRKTVPGEGK